MKTLIVVSKKEDVPASLGRVVTASEFLEGDGLVLEKGVTVVNLCRSFRYLSKGYYVSLLADARGQPVIPTVDTLETLGNPEATFRRLREAGIETVELARTSGKRKLLPATIAPGEDSPDVEVRPSVPLVRQTVGDSVTYRPALDAELAETTVCLGSADERRFKRLGAAVYRLWPSPAIRLRLLREDGRWKVLDVTALRFGRLGPAGRDHLVATLGKKNLARSGPPAEVVEKTLAICVLFDENDATKPSTEETIDRLEHEAARMGVYVHRIGPTELGRVGEYDALFIRTLTGLDLPAFRFALHAEALGMPVIDDSRSIIRCGNKVFLRELLSREGIPIPKTLTVTRESSFADVTSALGLPFILKVPDGSFSMAVFKVGSEEEYGERIAELTRSSPLLIAQAFSPTDFDWRVGVLDGKVLFTAKYYMAKGHWQIRAATPRGASYGRVEAVPREKAPRDVVRVACKAASLIGSGLYGVDMKETPSGPVVIEINDNPNIDIGYEDAVDGDRIYEEIVGWFVRRARRRPKGRRRPSPARSAADLALRAPIGDGRGPPSRSYRSFEVCGIELEYAVVDRDLNVVSLVAPLLSTLAGHAASDVALGSVSFSNEIMDHVLEIKTHPPRRSLVKTEAFLVEGVRRAAEVLAAKHDARLLPTGMHPWFKPARARLWRRSNRAVYSAYERVFDVQSHGFANVHACHVNLPLGREEDAVRMMNAASLILPYLPAVAASSPMYDGELQPAVDNRLVHVIQHQDRVPETQGAIVPEYVESLSDYRKRVLKPMYRALDGRPEGRVLRREFLNARGAVFKFSRDSMEVRILDMQECVKMDVAIAAFVRAALKALAERLKSSRYERPDHAVLAADFRATVEEGTKARVRAPHLAPGAARRDDGTVDVRTVLTDLLDMARGVVRSDEAHYLDLVASIVERGNLSERMARVLERRLDEPAFTENARRLFIRLSECLVENEPWES